MELCRLQHQAGRHYVFEQPQSSRAWNLESVIELTTREGVLKTIFHQCMYGLVSWGELGLAPAYKPTSMLTNHSALAEFLQTKCAGGHRHVQLLGKHACSKAAVYPPGLCAAVVKWGPHNAEEAGRVQGCSRTNSRVRLGVSVHGAPTGRRAVPSGVRGHVRGGPHSLGSWLRPDGMIP